MSTCGGRDALLWGDIAGSQREGDAWIIWKENNGECKAGRAGMPRPELIDQVFCTLLSLRVLQPLAPRAHKDVVASLNLLLYSSAQDHVACLSTKKAFYASSPSSFAPAPPCSCHAMRPPQTRRCPRTSTVIAAADAAAASSACMNTQRSPQTARAEKGLLELPTNRLTRPGHLCK